MNGSASENNAPLKYNCIFDFAGCKKTFDQKKTWKRHVEIQHFLLNYWRCTEGACANNKTHPSRVIFTRKDLFIQHLRRTHAPKDLKSNNNTGKSTPQLAEWDTQARTLQTTAIHSRCAPPVRIQCPVPECIKEVFHGAEVLGQWTEHVAVYHVSGGNHVLCDLQGGICQHELVLSDPVILSRTGDYGVTDLGRDGISSFFSQHDCNQHCRPNWTKPANPRLHFNPVPGTTMLRRTVPTAASRPSDTRNYRN
ncbi:hypothetical protein NEMBOFW57_009491 [Staphylotrichum longicolle]|uniref:Alpha-type protein kinase domain-containing protein n=1 Tax=Staphylotrichum longicolle TaxID=669026 RepID=A0AAD4EP47_9PEZI|nr:hypothetical protein NEMBOFW57_009491 [Staphylotrichum longicolle]